MNQTTQRAWEWRKASDLGIMLLDRDQELGRHIFHAYDVNDNAACCVSVGLIASVEEPNEGSELCPDCATFVSVHRSGRELRDYSAGR